MALTPDASLNSIIARIPVGVVPQAAAYDGATDTLYVADVPPHTSLYGASVISATLNKVVANVTDLASYPLDAATYDPTNGYVYLVNPYQGNVTVVSSATNSLLTTLRVGNNPQVATYNPENGEVYVANGADSNVTIIQGPSIVGTVSLPGVYPGQVTFDPATGNFYAPDTEFSNVSVFSGTTNKVLTAVDTAEFPTAVTYDPANGDLYAAANGPGPSGSVTVISGATNTAITTLGVGEGPQAPTFDAANGDLYVSNFDSGTVSVISGATNTVVATLPAGVSPQQGTYDPANGEVYVSNWASGNLTIIQSSTNTVLTSIPIGPEVQPATFDPANADVYVPSEYTENVSVIAGGVTVQFDESGLSPGTSWSATFGGTVVTSTQSTLSFDVLPGSYDYQVGPVTGYTVAPASGMANVGVSFYTIGVTFTSTAVPTYTVTVDETGLATDTSWSAIFGGVEATGTSPSETFQVTEGSYSYQILPVAGYTASPTTGTATVDGPYLIEVTFTPTVGPSYTVTIDETGLPSGTDWSAILGGSESSSTTSSISFSVPAGSYDYQILSVTGYTVSPEAGTASVAGAYLIEVVFTSTAVPTYTVSIVETGLVSGTSWSTVFGGIEATSTTTLATFDVSAGTYAYQVLPVAGYTASPSSGTATVNGSYLLEVTFSASVGPTYTVTIEETGLPSTTSWSAILGGTESSSTTSSITFGVTSGSYDYQILPVDGYSASPEAGTASVAGTYLIEVVFTSTAVPTYTVSIVETGLASATSWTTVFGGVEASTTTAAATFDVAAGTYSYQVLPVAGYTASPTSGTATVAGAYVIEVTFTATVGPSYTVTIVETGLPTGTTWSAIFDGAEGSSSDASVTFSVPAGSYSYQVLSANSYLPSPAYGTASVAGSYLIEVSFATSSSTTSLTTQVSVVGYSEGFTILAAVAATALGFGVAAVVLGRRPRPPAPAGPTVSASP